MARTQTPTIRNCDAEFPTFAEIAGVNRIRNGMDQPRPGDTTSFDQSADMGKVIIKE